MQKSMVGMHLNQSGHQNCALCSLAPSRNAVMMTSCFYLSHAPVHEKPTCAMYRSSMAFSGNALQHILVGFLMRHAFDHRDN